MELPCTNITRTKHRIVPGNNIFRYNIPYILNLTPNYSYYLKKIILDEIDKLISSGIDIENQKLGAYYVLIGFTEVSYECSQSLPLAFPKLDFFLCLVTSG